jgi:hypothetical protein
MIRKVLLVGICALALTGCGKSDQVTIIRPNHPLYDGLASCESNPSKPPDWICPRHFDLRRLLGLSVTAAAVRAKEHALRIRVVERDGRLLTIEDDLLSNRVDVSVVGSTVTSIRKVG